MKKSKVEKPRDMDYLQRLQIKEEYHEKFRALQERNKELGELISKVQKNLWR